MRTRIHLRPDRCWKRGRFRTGVSLHSHTLHSRESLNFIYHASRKSALLRWVLRRGEVRYRAIHGIDLDLNLGWWTPPLAPLDAFALEEGQIQELGLRPIVSLTDHDDIEAPMSLQAVEASRAVPVSVEWTVPYRDTFFHLGVHNLPPPDARAAMRRLAAFTAKPAGDELTAILRDLAAQPGTLIVFNHPLWDEKGIGSAEHRRAALDLLLTRGEYLHALELNGLRPWRENNAVTRLARDWGKPVISGGDRHTIEPNATLNLTRAATFAEFAQEIRQDRRSEVLIMPQYHAPHASRIFHSVLDVFRTYDNHGHGWTEWSDRVFYTGRDGTAESLTRLWEGKPPAAAALFAGIMHLAGRPSVRQVLRSVAAAVPAISE